MTVKKKKIINNESSITVKTTPVYAGYYKTSTTLVFSSKESDVSDADEKYGDVSNSEYKIRDIPWYKNKGNIRTVNFKNKVVPTNISNWFEDCSKLEKINNIQNLDTSNMTSMYAMFKNCNSLKNLDLSSFNTANVTDMAYMFAICENLTTVDISSFNTENTTNMESMFGSFFHSGYEDDGGINLSNLIISDTTWSKTAPSNYEYMFDGANKIPDSSKPSWYLENPM